MSRHSLFTFLTLLILWTVVSQINHYLAVWHLYVFVGGLFITIPALRLPFREGFMATLMCGLLCDANSPAPFGTHLLLFALAHVLIHKSHHRVPKEETIVQVIVAFVVNLGLYFALTIVLSAGALHPGPVIPRLLFDLFISQLFLLLIAPWFFALQTKVLNLDRAERRY